MEVKNLDNGNVITVGEKFLQRQPKPVIGSTGKLYKDGFWVEHKAPKMSSEAARVINEAKTQGPKAPTAAPETSNENKVV